MKIEKTATTLFDVTLEPGDDGAAVCAAAEKMGLELIDDNDEGTWLAFEGAGGLADDMTVIALKRAARGE